MLHRPHHYRIKSPAYQGDSVPSGSARAWLKGKTKTAPAEAELCRGEQEFPQACRLQCTAVLGERASVTEDEEL